MPTWTYMLIGGAVGALYVGYCTLTGKDVRVFHFIGNILFWAVIGVGGYYYFFV